MKYDVYVRKRFSYIKSYRVLKSTRGNSNPFSRWVLGLVDKYVLKKQSI